MELSFRHGMYFLFGIYCSQSVTALRISRENVHTRHRECLIYTAVLQCIRRPLLLIIYISLPLWPSVPWFKFRYFDWIEKVPNRPASLNHSIFLQSYYFLCELADFVFAKTLNNKYNSLKRCVYPRNPHFNCASGQVLYSCFYIP